MKPLLKWFYSRPPSCILLALAILIALAALGEGNTQLGRRPSKRPAAEPALVKRGEKLPLYNFVNDPDTPTLVDGIRTLGEWMKTVGLFEGETPFVESHLDPSEPFELAFENVAPQEDQFKTLTREDAKTTSSADVSVPAVPCSRRGLLVNKTGIVVRCLIGPFCAFLRFVSRMSPV